ncbi:MAG: hypothetical protein WC156_08230 [Pedobacter sp.]
MRPMLRCLMVVCFPALLLIFAFSTPLLAAISCELNYPASDIARLFPDSNDFKTTYFSFSTRGGDPLLRKVEKRLGGMPALYAPLDVPYVIYEIYKGKKQVGYVHGVNQKGQFGVLEVFVSLDMKGTIKAFYLQRISGPWGRKFTIPKFGKQFVGLDLMDFEQYDPVTAKGSGKVASISNPAPEAKTDFSGILRALKKNLILMDEFFYSTEKMAK